MDVAFDNVVDPCRANGEGLRPAIMTVDQKDLAMVLRNISAIKREKPMVTKAGEKKNGRC